MYSLRSIIGVTRTVGVVWVCRRFDYSHFSRRFGVAVLTIDPVEMRYMECDQQFVVRHKRRRERAVTL